MTNDQINKYGMFLVVITVLERFAAVIALMPAFGKAVASFKRFVADIGKTSEDVVTGTSAKTKVKRNAANEMAATVAALLGKLHAWASDTGNTELKEKSDISESDIEAVRDAERAVYARAQVGLVDENKASLADYNITDEVIEDAIATITAFENSLGDRNTTRAKQTGGREFVTETFAKADAVLIGQIDKLVASEKKNHPDFYNEYTAARVIRDIAATRPSAENKPPAPPA